MVTPSEEFAQIEIAESRMQCINRHKQFILAELISCEGISRLTQSNREYWMNCLRLVNKDDGNAGTALMEAYAAAAEGSSYPPTS